MHIPGAPDPAVMEAIEQRGHCVVFLDVAAANTPLGRIKLELFTKDCPKTVRCMLLLLLSDTTLQGGYQKEA